MYVVNYIYLLANVQLFLLETDTSIPAFTIDFNMPFCLFLVSMMLIFLFLR